MAKKFIHLSDIHFGQETGGALVTHNDAKERLIDDVEAWVQRYGPVDGVFVTGDIAYSGKQEEYRAAGAWLDWVAAAGGCSKTAVQVVPGNHDIDRDQISHLGKMLLDAVIQQGEVELDKFLASPQDREVLYSRFEAYRPFAEGYNCPLDLEGGDAGKRSVEVAAGRRLRFVGLNTALICSLKDREGTLLLGARQRVLPITVGEELVVLAHHPLRYLQDSNEAGRYVRNRARVLITGHEHKPGMLVEHVDDGVDLLLLAAGATTPPHAGGAYTYCYNIIEFAVDAATEHLVVTVHARAWDDDKVAFGPPLSTAHPSIERLESPNFRRANGHQLTTVRESIVATHDGDASTTVKGTEMAEVKPMDDKKFSIILLQFFRDLNGRQRLQILMNLGALPEDWTDSLTHAVERHAVDLLAREGRLDELESEIQKTLLAS